MACLRCLLGLPKQCCPAEPAALHRYHRRSAALKQAAASARAQGSHAGVAVNFPPLSRRPRRACTQSRPARRGAAPTPRLSGGVRVPVDCGWLTLCTRPLRAINWPFRVCIYLFSCPCPQVHQRGGGEQLHAGPAWAARGGGAGLAGAVSPVLPCLAQHGKAKGRGNRPVAAVRFAAVQRVGGGRTSAPHGLYRQHAHPRPPSRPPSSCWHPTFAPPLLPRIPPASYLVTLGGLGHPGGVMLQVITGVGRHRWEDGW